MLLTIQAKIEIKNVIRSNVTAFTKKLFITLLAPLSISLS